MPVQLAVISRFSPENTSMSITDFTWDHYWFGCIIVEYWTVGCEIYMVIIVILVNIGTALSLEESGYPD